ncbi:Cysteine desulfurase [Rubripirellula tenax]|uniref:cysteine desulfurase n=1 Tax=Rubripirellula tenax TaxID=2528015 RepID=A0A5C6EXT1_9BACT|nr:cysteine desulfurase family protein [Rubripirellula tenax]TWU54433.1 Cysteine desulfurase [Rubripirellula tenax]
MIYLDNHSTTRCDTAVVDAMLPWLTQEYGNPHSSHAAGIAAADIIGRSIATVAGLVGAKPDSIVFTSGATESNNLAIRGVCLHPRQKRRHIVTVTTEHPAVLDVVEDLKRDGFRVTIVPVIQSGSPGAGIVDIDRLAAAIDDDTAIVSVMAANNEVGSIAPMRAIADLVHDRGAVLHCDATQVLGRSPIDIAAMDIDLVSGSAHKFYGPKGIGVLVVGGGDRRIRLRPQIVGGGQQRGIRSGTMAPAMAVGLARALEICTESMDADRVRIRAMRDTLWQRLCDGIAGIELNGPALGGDDRLAGNLNFRLPTIEGESWMAAAAEVAFSTGSACSNVDPTPSHVLMAMGLSESEARRSARFGIGRFNTMDEMERASAILVEARDRLANLA